MANRSPGLVQVTTTSTGSGPYTLTNTVPAASDYRSIANAVADGSLANGDTVHYVIFQSGAPTGKMFERGWGTINTTTLVLTVVSVIEKSAALSSGGWGAGTKDVYFAPPGAESVALIDQINTFTQNQNINKTSPAFYLQQGGVTRAALTYVGVDFWLQYFNSSSVLRGELLLGENNVWRHYNSSGVMDGQLELGAGTLNFSDGATVRKVVRFVGGGVVKMTFNCAPPTGWTRINVTGERLGKYATASDTPEAQAGSWTLSGLTTPFSATGAHAITIAEMPSHKHEIYESINTVIVSLFSGNALASPGGGTVMSAVTRSLFMENTGGGAPHSHTIDTMAVASSGGWRPPYEIIVKASHD